MIMDEDCFKTYNNNRPSELENVCLYDFVAHYDGTDKNGEHKYRKLTKHVLPNHINLKKKRELLLLTHDPVRSFPE